MNQRILYGNGSHKQVCEILSPWREKIYALRVKSFFGLHMNGIL